MGGLRVDPEFCDLVPGDTRQLRVLGADGEVVEVRWASADERVARVDGDGWLTAVGDGSTEVQGHAAPHLADPPPVRVRVVAPPDDFPVYRFEPSELLLAVGGSAVVVLHALQGSSDTMGHVVDWRSSDANVVTVEGNGTVVAHAAGQAVVTGLIGDRVAGTHADATVTVVDGFRGFVSFRTEHERYRVVQGGSITVNLIGRRPDGREELTYPDEWTVSGGLATADATGVVTGVQPGTTELAASYDGGRAQVVFVPLEVVAGIDGGVTARAESERYVVPVGTTVVVRALGTVPPQWEDPDEVTRLSRTDVESTTPVPVHGWRSDDESIATIDADGLVTGVGVGTTTVSGATAEGRGEPIWATIEVVDYR